MRYWSIVLHLYQPATQDPRITETVANACYLPLLRMLGERKKAALSVNISGSLLAQMARLGIKEFFRLAGDLAREGRLEILISPAHHPLVPIAPFGMLEKQIDLGREAALRQLGVEPVRGLFFPELAVDDRSLKRVFGHGGIDFAVVDQTAVGGPAGAYDYEGRKLLAGDRELCEIIRSTPDRLETGDVEAYVGAKYGEEELVVSVNDAEVFGHHYEERGEFLGELLGSEKFRFVKASEAVERFGAEAKRAEKIEASSWQNTTGFDLWTQGELQKRYLGVARMAYALFFKFGEEADETTREIAREHLDQGWSSCNLYWLSNDPWWHPELVERGANNLIRCVRTLPVPYEDKVRAEARYHRFLEQMWLYHWSGEVEEGYRKHEKKRGEMLAKLKQSMGQKIWKELR